MAAPQKGQLTASERKILQVIEAGDVQEAALLLACEDVRVNCLDEDGMTPLMHAAYKGKAEMCRLLLQHGADVNCNQHQHGYTALMFAGLSGKTDITSMMLDAGADTDMVNSVGRTAAQMAAFVGQHDCVTVINNFFSRARLEYYTRPQGLEREPKLPPGLAGPLHKIIMTTNLNPVKIVMLVRENPVLVDVVALEKCYQVMDLLCEQCVKQQDMNEVLAMKMHYISCVLQKCVSFLQKQDDKLDALVKSLLRGRDSDGFPQYQEKFIRDCIRKFPYCETTLLQELVRTIAPVEIGNDPTAFSVLSQALTGQMAFVDADYCATCGERGADKRCSLCKAVTYCSLACQKLHWFTHKKMCRAIQEQNADLERDAPRLKELKDDESDLVMETANFLQELCLRAEEKVAAAGGCPGELLVCPSVPTEGPSGPQN
uniref:ankyrin repeat and MYND domain-containing protein 2-like isoform X1 n=1 Tax=Doryrhamphus excisus TaxID=161450 RepID=UPI0025ADC3E4|nr:ankyrin repeat and MYND domain-containing protein 2-like isoform X1 [Doryrhamphus excisus]XP_057903110.1 ankyrin repeat and MYND domain-containing protein 2-like isoform X1 [Doryrhamphus excisus]XP_057903111.1 ankyrin repeat and MYND domain-containing protein 2-like isoform X1 [Doryrhamphus excisus]